MQNKVYVFSITIVEGYHQIVMHRGYTEKEAK